MQPKRIKLDISGVIMVDKPLGYSSNQALSKIKWLFNPKKAGHTGTLDPLATGLLPICLGEATKFSSFLLESDKTYEASIKLGFKSNTGDSEGIIESLNIEQLPSLKEIEEYIRFTLVFFKNLSLVPCPISLILAYNRASLGVLPLP